MLAEVQRPNSAQVPSAFHAAERTARVQEHWETQLMSHATLGIGDL